MPRMEIENIDLGEVMDIERRRQVRLAEIKHANRSSVSEDDSPFSDENMRHATKKRVQMRKSERKDIQNIGSGTRCLACGCLHFCWAPKCGACGNAMTFNLGHHSMGRRVV